MMSFTYNAATKTYGYKNVGSTSYSANLKKEKDSKQFLELVMGQSGSLKPNMGTAQFLNKYQFLMKGLSGSANKLRELNQDGLNNNFTANSSDTNVLEVSSEGNIKEKAEYDVNVLQLAEKQITKTDGVQSDEKNAFTDGSEFEIKLPNQSSKSKTINVDTKGGTRTNREVQVDIASQINSAGLGLNASVVEKDGESYLQIESKTGKDNSFDITGQPGFTKTQEAKNLEYTLSKNGIQMGNGTIYKSEKNENVRIDGYKISANFKKTGSAKIAIDVDTNDIRKATEDFVNQYNKTVEFLVDNAHRGTGVSKTLDNLMRAPISKDAMKTIGITMEENGLFTLDSKKFEQALARDPKKVYDVLSDNYSIADGVYQDVERGLNMSSDSLIDRDVEKIVLINNYLKQSFLYDYGFFGRQQNIYQLPLFLDMRV